MILLSTDLPRYTSPLFQQQSYAAGTSLSFPVVTSALNDTAFASPPVDIAHVNPRTFVKNCVSNLAQVVPSHINPSLQRVMTVTTVKPQQFTAPLTTNNSLVTQIFPNLSSCTNPLPRVLGQPIAFSHAFTILDVANGKVSETSNPVGPVKSRGTVFYGNPSAQTAPYCTKTINNSPQQNTLSINAPPSMGPTASVAPANRTVQDIAQLFAATKKILFQCVNYHKTGATLCYGMNGSANFKVP